MLAPSAYLASAASCRALVLRLVPSIDTLPSIHQASQQWTNSYEELELPKEGERSKQKAWDRPIIEGCFRSLLSSAQDDRNRARLLAVTCKESGLWLQVPPISSLGPRMDDDVIRIATGLRLRVPLCIPHRCQHCGSQVDKLATHGLSCRKSQGR